MALNPKLEPGALGDDVAGRLARTFQRDAQRFELATQRPRRDGTSAIGLSMPLKHLMA